jgi:isopentenyldiphosphate isomerase
MTKEPLRDDIEYVIQCDSEGNVIGPISKTYAHSDGIRETLTHYSTWSMIYNPVLGKYGLQRKNPNKQDKLTAGKWDMGVAGHNCYIKENGEYRPVDFAENLVKEAKEEIGIDLKMYETQDDFLQAVKNSPHQISGFIFDKFHFKTEDNNEWVGLGFISMPTTEVHFEDDEVVDFKWLSPQEMKEYLENNNDYCSPLPLVFEKAETFRKSNKNNL